MKSYDGRGKINKDDFLIALRDIGILFPKVDSEQLVQFFDKDIDGSVNFEEFMLCIRGLPNEERSRVVNEAFQKFDKERKGYANIRDLKGVFNSSTHPKVLSGEVTEDQVFDEFIRNFNDSYNEGIINKYEWDDYYSAVSKNVDSDEHFIYLVRNVWRMSC